MLDELYDALLPVIRDSKRRTPSPAFRTFFKESSKRPFVTALLTNTIRGTAKTPPQPPSSPNGSPTFMCVNAPNQFKYTEPDPKGGGRRLVDALTLCKPSSPAFYLGMTPPQPYIIVCPSFWTNGIPDIPPPRNCLDVDAHTNRYREDGRDLRQYQMWYLFEEIAHYYIYTMTKRTDVLDVYDINDCVGLSPELSSLNAVSFVYYAASEYLICQR